MTYGMYDDYNGFDYYNRNSGEFSSTSFRDKEVYTIKEEDNRDPIDYEPLRNPVVTKCGHLFSMDNLIEWLNRSPSPQCPLDRTPLSARDIWKIKKLQIGDTADALPSENTSKMNVIDATTSELLAKKIEAATVKKDAKERRLDELKRKQESIAKKIEKLQKKRHSSKNRHKKHILQKEAQKVEGKIVRYEKKIEKQQHTIADLQTAHWV